MRASIPDAITGTLDIVIALADDAAAEPGTLVELVSTWVRAVEISLFGPARIRVQQPFEPHGRRVLGSIECEDVPRAAFHVLSRMIRYFSNVKGKVDSFNVFEDGRHMLPAGEMTFSPLPQSVPFTVEYPEDLKHYVRIEIEFRYPLTANEPDAIFDAFSVWDAVIEAIGEEEREGRSVDYRSRVLSPAMVEHYVHGYYAGFECLQCIVWLALRLDRRLTIERLTIE